MLFHYIIDYVIMYDIYMYVYIYIYIYIYKIYVKVEKSILHSIIYYKNKSDEKLFCFVFLFMFYILKKNKLYWRSVLFIFQFLLFLFCILFFKKRKLLHTINITV